MIATCVKDERRVNEEGSLGRAVIACSVGVGLIWMQESPRAAK